MYALKLQQPTVTWGMAEKYGHFVWWSLIISSFIGWQDLRFYSVL